MLNQQAEHDFVETMRRVHENLHAHIREFRELVAGQPTRGSVLAMLRTLSSELQKHFELEERDGYLGEAVAHAPRLSDQANRLLRQHAVLTEELSVLVAVANRDAATDELPADFATLADTFIRKIIAHERAEDNLIQNAYEQDVEAKD